MLAALANRPMLVVLMASALVVIGLFIAVTRAERRRERLGLHKERPPGR